MIQGLAQASGYGMKMKYWSGSSGIALGIVSSDFPFSLVLQKIVLSGFHYSGLCLGGLILNLLIPWGGFGLLGVWASFSFSFFFSFKIYDLYHISLRGRPCLQTRGRLGSY